MRRHMRFLLKLSIVVSTLLFSSSSLFAADYKTKSCTPTSRIKTVPVVPDPHQVLRGGGIPGATIHTMRFSMLEQRYANCRIALSGTFAFTEYNYFQSAGRPPGRAGVTLTMMSGGQV